MNIFSTMLILTCLSIAVYAQEKLDLNYDFSQRAKLKYGYNDLNFDGIDDALLTKWRGKTMLFVSDDGKLPFKKEDENRNWNDFFNKAFDAGVIPYSIWNEIRADWGNYTIFIDLDDCERFDSHGDWYYKVMDFNKDGRPEAEYFNTFPGMITWDNPHSSKLHINFNGECDMSFIDWQYPRYENEQYYHDGYKYVMNVHGSGMFMNSFRKGTFTNWENPIAWYDFNCNGFTDMVMRTADIFPDPEGHRGIIGEAEFAFELNKNTGKHKYSSLDMQITYYFRNLDYHHKNKLSDKTGKSGFNYLDYIDRIPGIEGMTDTQYLSENLKETRLQIYRAHIPYMDGYKLLSDHNEWAGVFLLFDEDDDDVRWEEMFGRYEEPFYADNLGDRFEDDRDFGGEGKLYVGRFDGKIHLYHSEFSIWDIDYLGLYKGSGDRPATDVPEGPVPPVGLLYNRIRYHDTNNNGFADKIEYITVNFTNTADIPEVENIYKTINLLDYADEEIPNPDMCELFDPRVDSKITGFSVANWNGNPLTPEDFKGTSIKDGYDKMFTLYNDVAENMWKSAEKLYAVAKKHNLNKSENLDKDLKIDYTLQELLDLKEYFVPKGYSRHISVNGRREKYNSGYWLREKVFEDIVNNSGLDKFILEKYYYTNRVDKLCKYIDDNLK